MISCILWVAVVVVYVQISSMKKLLLIYAFSCTPLNLLESISRQHSARLCHYWHKIIKKIVSIIWENYPQSWFIFKWYVTGISISMETMKNNEIPDAELFNLGHEHWVCFFINSVFFRTLNWRDPKCSFWKYKGEQEYLVSFSSVYKWSKLFLHDFNVSFVLWICSTNNVADWSLSFPSQRSWPSVHLEGSGSICSHHTRLSLNEAASVFICSQVWRQTLHMLSLQVSISPQFVLISALSFVFHWNWATNNEP